ncbi:phage antirepressor protein [Pseudomonas syringae]|uniref:Phage antirepressor protein n=1 Tax=Pseudomonas syringae TaxID=317 RepID=A0A1C7ZDC2_PSESX|nr:Bro-N domain-containing protein [Pseudomonas syringae]OCR26548.1 phage antirepressor protein [Pseudomonas syringae]
MDAIYEPLVFTRHKLPLHALIIERQAWFSARDLGRLVGMFFENRITRKLDSDQRRTVRLICYGEVQEVQMISESAVYALLIYHHHPANSQLRQWLTYDVMPILNEAPSLHTHNSPTTARLEWQGAELSVLHWQNEPWIRLRDMPSLLPGRAELQVKPGSWWKKARMLLGINSKERVPF